MSLFDEIQHEIVSSASLSAVLRKAKVLAYRLKNQEFKDWIEHELNGYENKQALPEYRKIQTHSNGNFLNSAWKVSDAPIPPNNIPAEFREFATEVNMFQGIKELEALLETLDNAKTDTLSEPWPANLLPLLNERVYANMLCMGAWKVITKGNIAGIIENTRNRLLSFILELTERYPEVANEEPRSAAASVPDDQIRQVFNYYIMGDSTNIVSSAKTVSQGGNMAIFDQRNQKVNYQYNAAGDINFDRVQNRVELVAELEKLTAELAKASSAGAIDAEIATDAGYEITKAIQQAKKPEPNKKTILDRISNAETLIKSVSVVTGLVAALAKAAELVHKFF